jgi:hypothetical protein
MRTMDLHTRQHLAAWLKSSVAPGERIRTRRMIVNLIERAPYLLEGRSRPEILEIAERA